MNKQIEAAKAAESDGKVWQAYRDYSDAAIRFKGYELPRDITATVKKLRTDKAVKAELTALRILAAARKKLGGKSVSAGKGPGFPGNAGTAGRQAVGHAGPGQEAQRLIDALKKQ
ncbi:MAG: hypothetical protein CM1200mP2_01220 [Planctomycetaceae bacterium]|nr:MAG: hypothetical protein CM1200mP2_01220 [Planctomycetaceae bacterium]